MVIDCYCRRGEVGYFSHLTYIFL
ncbi:hypothetical protein DRO59_00595 [Candidatus Bathyarchaeota archaeon]|nr:MAG: hypothetical protein DRO59_00595 [Candidatus Bathyarchaeota archaeon]